MRRRVSLILFVLLWAMLLTACGKPTVQPDSDRLQIVTTIFPAYDFARAAAGDRADVYLLLPPGAESHSYEPTPADILAVQNCDFFLYLGGESDAWVDTILEAVKPTGTALRMVDCVELLDEETVAGMQAERGHHHEEEDDHDHDHHEGEVVDLDEHVWTSPLNAAAITRCTAEELAVIDPANCDAYRANAEAYAARLEALDGEFAALFETCAHPVMVFGDRFPLRYFAAAYDLEYYAAFPGCSTQTEPSAATVAFLTDLIREEQVSTVWYIEFSNHLVADSIAEATGAHTALFQTCHNVSRQQLEDGVTYVSLMEENLASLRTELS